MTDENTPTPEDDLGAAIERLLMTLPIHLTEETLGDLPDNTIVLSDIDGTVTPSIRRAGAWNVTPSIPALTLVEGWTGLIHREERRSARNTDPETSHRPSLNRAARWDSMTMKALRIFADHDREEGLTYAQVNDLAEARWGDGALGVSPWKRCSELHTDYIPALIDLVSDDNGKAIKLKGNHGDPNTAYRISDAGRQWLRKTEPVSV